MVNNIRPEWLWDRNISIEEIKNILRNPQHPRFLEIASLLLSRENSPKEIFKEYLDQVLFVSNWARIKRQMRKNSWSDPRIIFWQAVYEKLVAGIKSRGITIRERAGTAVPSGLNQSAAAKIKSARQELNLTQQEFADRLGISQQIISRIEKGQSDLRLSTLERVLRFLGERAEIKSSPDFEVGKFSDGKKVEDLQKEVKCPACGLVLFHISPLDEKGEAWGISAKDSKKFKAVYKREGERTWYECPACRQTAPTPGVEEG